MRMLTNGYLHQLTFMPRTFPVNCYLVEEESSLTLIDAALPYSAKSILKAADTIGKPITHILLTHAHGDHLGALDDISQILTDVPVYISARDSRLLSGDFTLEVNEHQTPIKGGIPKNLITRATFLINEGDVIGSLVCINSPGHTPGSMSFLDRRTDAIIAGDAFQTRGGIAVSGDLKPWFPFPALATWSKPTALASAKKLVTYGPQLLAVGHGQMIENPIPLMEEAIANLEMKITSRVRI